MELFRFKMRHSFKNFMNFSLTDFHFIIQLLI